MIGELPDMPVHIGIGVPEQLGPLGAQLVQVAAAFGAVGLFKHAFHAIADKARMLGCRQRQLGCGDG